MTRLAAIVILFALAVPAFAQTTSAPYTRVEDVVYGRKYGTALTLDVFKPKENANGAGVIWCISGGWFSSHGGINPTVAQEFTDRGYTVFAVVHGSNPLFSIPDVLEDMHRAVRFIRANADKYGVDPERLGITGGSAGGHLSLMQAVASKPGNPKAMDPVERQSSKVHAAALFYPPTDFLNYGTEGENAMGVGTLAGFKAPFDFKELDPKTKMFERITDPERRLSIGKAISPVYHVSKDSAPALIIHGDADKLVPIQQAELMQARYQAAGVPFELVVKKGAAHGWLNMQEDRKQIIEWFDKHLGAGK